MSQRVKAPPVTNIENDPVFLRGLVRGVGYVLVCIGWILFALGVVFLFKIGNVRCIEEPFRWASYWIVPGWLLLRFADGLFPFSKKFFKTIKESLS
jgi:hypothetical protein